MRSKGMIFTRTGINTLCERKQYNLLRNIPMKISCVLSILDIYVCIVQKIWTLMLNL